MPQTPIGTAFLVIIGLMAAGIIIMTLVMNRPQQGIGGAITGSTEQSNKKGISGREERINTSIYWLTVVWLVFAFLYHILSI